jgi:hypothetical protein
MLAEGCAFDPTAACSQPISKADRKETCTERKMKMAKRRKTGATIDQDGNPVRMPHEEIELNSIPSVIKAYSNIYNGVGSGRLDPENAGRMNGAAGGALKGMTTLLKTAEGRNASEAVLQAMTAQICGMSVAALTGNGAAKKKEPRRRRQGPDKKSESDEPTS